MAVLVRYHTPNVYTAVVAWYDVAPGGVAFFAGQFLLSTSRIWFARMGVRLGWHADNPEQRVAAPVLDVKGDCCHGIRRMLAERGRDDDYSELSLDGRHDHLQRYTLSRPPTRTTRTRNARS